MSFRARVRDEILQALRELPLAVAPGDDITVPRKDDIEWRRLPAPGAVGQQEFVVEQSPCIILSAPRISLPPSEGENDRDIWHLQWLIQICSQEMPNSGKNQNTYWNWQEQIADQFNFWDFNDVINDVVGVVYMATSQLVDDVDVKTWVRAQHFVAGVAVTVDLQRRRRVGRTIN